MTSTVRPIDAAADLIVLYGDKAPEFAHEQAVLCSRAGDQSAEEGWGYVEFAAKIKLAIFGRS
jgi:hypothetical protein